MLGTTFTNRKFKTRIQKTSMASEAAGMIVLQLGLTMQLYIT